MGGGKGFRRDTVTEKPGTRRHAAETSKINKECNACGKYSIRITLTRNRSKNGSQRVNVEINGPFFNPSWPKDKKINCSTD